MPLLPKVPSPAAHTTAPAACWCTRNSANSRHHTDRAAPRALGRRSRENGRSCCQEPCAHDPPLMTMPERPARISVRNYREVPPRAPHLRQTASSEVPRLDRTLRSLECSRFQRDDRILVAHRAVAAIPVPRPQVERTHTLGSMNLVGRDGYVVDWQCVEAKRQFAKGLRRVDMQWDSQQLK